MNNTKLILLAIAMGVAAIAGQAAAEGKCPGVPVPDPAKEKQALEALKLRDAKTQGIRHDAQTPV